ncbi:MAG: tetratricopeptide repeat protein [Anaerolineae bacterium]|nr:tetratricopeptide repeat protein [Anaerolineae bacterium]
MAEYTPHEAPVHNPQALPVMLPTKLVGRDVLLAKIYGDLKNNDAVLVYGDSGIGKTALAATLASAYSELPGGVIWLSVENETLDDLIVRVARAFEMIDVANSDTPLAMIGALTAAIQQHKPLIVFDGDPDEEAVADFIDQCADMVPVLLTAPQDMDGPWSSVELTSLQPEQARALFNHIADVDEDNANDPSALVAALGGNPLAISISAASVKLNNQTPDAFLNSLPQSAGGAAPEALLALTTAFRGLPNALQGLMLMLAATFKGQGSGDLLSMISGAPVEGVNQAMEMLVNRHLVERFTRYGSSYYRLHPLVKDFGKSWLRGSQRLAGLENKVRDAIIAYASRFSNNNDRLAAEAESFVAAAQWAADKNDRDTPNQLAVSLMQAGDFVNARGYLHELLQIRRAAASSSTPFPAYASPSAPTVLPQEDVLDEEFDEDIEAEEFEEPPFDDELYEEDEVFDDEIEDELLDEEDFEDEEDDIPLPPQEIEPTPPEALGEMARLRASLVQARQLNDQRRQAEVLKTIASVYVRDGNENEAISNYAEALTLFEAVNDRGEVLNVLEALSTLEAKTENLDAAALHAARGISLADQLGEMGKQIHLVTTLGDVQQQLGESDAAIDTYEEALGLVRSANNARTEAVLLFKLGYAQLDNNNPEKASEIWETALKMFKTQERRDYEGRVLGALGAAYGELGRWTEATNFHTSSLYIAREVHDKQEEAMQLNSLGFAFVQANQLGQAVLRYRQALHLAYLAGDREDIVSTTVELANVLVQSPRHLLVTELLVDEALKQDPNDRDLRKLKERVTTEKIDAEARNVNFIPVEGTAHQYAENAYTLLDEA